MKGSARTLNLLYLAANTRQSAAGRGLLARIPRLWRSPSVRKTSDRRRELPHGQPEGDVGPTRHVWIVNHYARDSGVPRHRGLALELPRRGWSASLIAASTNHPSGEQELHGLQLRELTSEEGVQTLKVRTTAYGRSLPIRFIGMIVFAVNLLRPGILRGLPRPDVVLGSTVHPLAAWAAWRLARRHGIPFVYEIRDVWPDTLIDLGKLSESGVIAQGLRTLSRHLITNSSFVISPLPYIDRHLIELGIADKPSVWIPNGYPDTNAELTAASEGDSDFTFMYLGAHGNVNAIEGIIDAFDMACLYAPDLSLRLRLVGDGPLKNVLKQRAAKRRNTHRIAFEDRIPSSQVLNVAQEADCLVANIYDKAVYRFGISPNKLFTYLATNRPVVLASSAPNNPIADAGAGITVPGDDRPALAQAMVEMARTPAVRRAEMGRSGAIELSRKYSYSLLARQLAEVLDSVQNDA